MSEATLILLLLFFPFWPAGEKETEEPQEVPTTQTSTRDSGDVYPARD